jgi:hypothetical protein
VAEHHVLHCNSGANDASLNVSAFVTRRCTHFSCLDHAPCRPATRS